MKTTASEIPCVRYADNAGNEYGVERASNGMWICVRVNAGGNRHGFKTVGAAKTRERLQRVLDAWANGAGWTAVT